MERKKTSTLKRSELRNGGSATRGPNLQYAETHRAGTKSGVAPTLLTQKPPKYYEDSRAFAGCTEYMLRN